MKITPRKYAKSLLEALEDAPKNEVDVCLDNFLKIVESANDTKNLSVIIEEMEKIERENSGIKIAIITTPAALTESAAKEIIKKLEKIFNAKIELKNKIDPEILGGIVVESGEDFFDKSVKNYLNKFKQSLIN